MPTPMNDAPALSLRDVSFAYRSGAPVLHGVSAELGAGRLSVLLGPNAAGKSTLMKVALGQATPTAGSVTVAGERIESMDAARRAALVSYVPQRGSWGFTFGVREVVAMGRYALPRDEDAVDRAIEECDLAHLADAVFAELSIGQQQRVLLARAIAQARPHGRLMLLDEPGSAMDLWHVHAMMSLLRSQASRGLAVLVVLHDLNLAARYADEVWLMDGGKIVAAGAWDKVLTPESLGPVYRMKVRRVASEAGDRPALIAEPIA